MTGWDSVYGKCLSKMILGSIEHVSSEKYANTHQEINKPSLRKNQHRPTDKHRIIDNHTQTDFSSDENIQHVLSVDGFSGVDLQQIHVGNDDINRNSDLYPHMGEKLIEEQRKTFISNTIQTVHSACSIEYDKLSSDASDHQFDYDYQDPNEHYIEAYERKSGSNTDIDFNKIDNAIKRNKRNLKLIEKKNQKYSDSQGGHINPITNKQRTANTCSKYQHVPKLSPKLTTKTTNLQPFEVKTYIASVSYGNVCGAYGKDQAHIQNKTSCRIENKNLKKTRSKTTQEIHNKKQEHERLMQEIKFRLAEKRRISEELQRKMERKQRQEQKIEEKRMRLETEDLKRHLKVHASAFGQPRTPTAAGDNRRKRSVSVFGRKQQSIVMLAVEKATSIQSFFMGSDVQTQTELATTTPSKQSCISEQGTSKALERISQAQVNQNIAIDENTGPCTELEPCKDSQSDDDLEDLKHDYLESYAACGEFFTVIQNDDGTYSMGDQQLPLNDKRISKFFSTYKKNATDVSPVIPLPMMPEKGDQECLKLPSKSNTELIKAPIIKLENDQRKATTPVLKQITNQPKKLDVIKPVNIKLDQRPVASAGKKSPLPAKSSIVPLEQKNKAVEVQTRKTISKSGTRSRACEISIKKGESGIESECTVTYEEESRKSKVDANNENDPTRMRLLPILDEWPEIPTAERSKRSSNTTSICTTTSIKRASRPIKEVTKFDSDHSSITIFTESKDMRPYAFQDKPYKVNKVKIKKVSKVKSSITKHDIAHKSNQTLRRSKRNSQCSVTSRNRKPLKSNNVKQMIRKRVRTPSTIFKLLKEYEVKIFKCLDYTRRRLLECENRIAFRQTMLFTIYASTFIVVFGALRMSPPTCLMEIGV